MVDFVDIVIQLVSSLVIIRDTNDESDTADNSEHDSLHFNTVWRKKCSGLTKGLLKVTEL